MDRATRLQEKWANATTLMAGATIYLPEGEALVLDKADPRAGGELYGERGLWWAWSVSRQAYVLVKGHDKQGRGGWYEYRDGLGQQITTTGEEVA